MEFNFQKISKAGGLLLTTFTGFMATNMLLNGIKNSEQNKPLPAGATERKYPLTLVASATAVLGGTAGVAMLTNEYAQAASAGAAVAGGARLVNEFAYKGTANLRVEVDATGSPKRTPEGAFILKPSKYDVSMQGLGEYTIAENAAIEMLSGAHRTDYDFSGTEVMFEGMGNAAGNDEVVIFM